MLTLLLRSFYMATMLDIEPAQPMSNFREPLNSHPPPDPRWKHWLEQYGHKVMIRLVAMGLPLDLAEEVSQTSWERLMAKHGAGELERIDMPGLILTQARFLALDYLRREHPLRLRHLSDSQSVHGSLSVESNPQKNLITKQQCQLANKALSTCSQSSQEVFRLFYVENKKAKQIANNKDLSVQRVRQIVCEVRATLKQAMEIER